MEHQASEKFNIYRNTSLGASLLEACDEMVEKKLISKELREITLKIFDKKMAESFAKIEDLRHGRGSTATGRHINHNHCDGIWSFTLENVDLRIDDRRIPIDCLMIVTIDQEMNSFRNQSQDQDPI